MKRRRKLEGGGNNRNLQEGGKIYRYIPNRVFIRATIRSMYNRWQCDELSELAYTFSKHVNLCFNTHFRDLWVQSYNIFFEICKKPVDFFPKCCIFFEIWGIFLAKSVPT